MDALSQALDILNATVANGQAIIDQIGNLAQVAGGDISCEICRCEWN